MENNGLGSVETNPLSSPHSPDPVEDSLVDEQLSHATMLTKASPADETSSSELHDFNAFHAFRDAMDRTREFCRKQKAHFWKVLAALLWLLLVMNVVVGVALTVEFRTSNIVRNFDTLRSMKRIRNVMFIISGIAALAAFVTLVALLLRDSGLRDRRGLRGPIAIGDASSGEDQVPKCDREDETVEGANSALIWKPKAREWISVNFRKGCWSPWHRTVLGWALLLACVATWLLGLLFLTRHVNIRRSVKAEKAGSMSRMRFIFLVVVATVGVTMFVVERAIDSGSWKNRPVCISRRGAIVGKAADSYCVGRWFSSVALESPYSEVVVYDDVSREWELLVLPWKMLGGTNRCYYHDPLHGYTGSAAMYVLPPVICYLLGLPTVAIVFSVLAVLLPVEKPRGAFNVLLLGPWGEGALVLPRTLHLVVNTLELVLWYSTSAVFYERRYETPAFSLLYVLSTLLPLSSPCYRGLDVAEDNVSPLVLELPAVSAYVLVAVPATLTYNCCCLAASCLFLSKSILELLLSRRTTWRSKDACMHVDKAVCTDAYKDAYGAYYSGREILETVHGGVMMFLPPTGRPSL